MLSTASQVTRRILSFPGNAGITIPLGKTGSCGLERLNNSPKSHTASTWEPFKVRSLMPQIPFSLPFSLPSEATGLVLL